MSMNDGNTVNASTSSDPKRIEEPANKILYKLVEEIIKANL